MSKQVVIVGGGLAGLAAAAALAVRDVRVRLLESRPRLGGRASSFVDRTTGETIDNCQHVSMGCCTNLRHFCETTGLTPYFRRERELYFVGPDNRVNRFRAGRLPAPLHLLGALRGLSYLNRTDRRSIARGLRALAPPCSAAADVTFAQWLDGQRQTPAAIERFWKVVLVSALSETLDRVDVAHARKVFVDGFLANREGWQVEIPTVPLDELYGTRLTGWLSSHGADVQLGSGVQHVVIDDGQARGVELRGGEQITADEVILAVSHSLVAELLPEPLRSHSAIANLGRIETAPISSVHLWFDIAITDLPHAVLIERVGQWLFNRAVLQPGRDDRGHYYQVVISASRDLAGRAQQDTVATVVAELAAIWPTARAATLLHSRLVTEHKAVFSVRPGIDALRPQQQSPIANLQLAGDWTATGWPATMEGAVRSGYLAAENVLARLGRHERVLQPDLPVDFLPRVLLGL